MKVVLEVARRLSAARRRKRSKIKSRSTKPSALPAMVKAPSETYITISEKPEVQHFENTTRPSLRRHTSEKAVYAVSIGIEEVVSTSPQLRSDPPSYTECVGEKALEAEKQKQPEDTSVTKAAEAARGRPRELLYRSQYNELKEKGTLMTCQEQWVPFRKVVRSTAISIDYRAVYHKQAVAEVWYELFNIVKVAVWAILVWLLVCGMIPPLK